MGVLPCDRGNLGGFPWLLRFVTVYNAKGVFHDLVDTAHGGLRLGNRRLDIKQYNGLRKPLAAQEEIDRFSDQEEDVTEPSTLEVVEQETRPSISEIFDIVTPRERPNALHSESDLKTRTLSPASPAKKSDLAGSIIDQIDQLHISPPGPLEGPTPHHDQTLPPQ